MSYEKYHAFCVLNELSPCNFKSLQAFRLSEQSMFVLNLTAEELSHLMNYDYVTCTRGELLFMVERKNGRIKTIIFDAPVKVYAYTNNSQHTAIRV